ncbi:hypothetical protein F5Y00DRAFT_232389 [Daldinia vernicosa]|uniref:uncharacterized protein n=1 Tax=Daldinia vernicosa TaxID=114800 RepID=UPI0020085659|nr:uncharacterized protein F5Y00DRAFT_232389 [Daldinia vernicosa]KAI0850503.1 hypothetical protein F5Y00DRAFT_232389 [Daldinia vernicosa]
MKGLRSPFPLVLAVLGCLGRISSADGQGLTRRAVDNPGPDGFIRHRYPSVVPLGNYIYIDGGQMFQQNNGNGSNSTQSDPYTSYPVSSTLSLNLNESWTNETVEFRAIPKAAPLLGQQVYWTDRSYNPGAFYVWGGKTMDNGSPPEDQLWYFSADGSGGGSWSQLPQGDYRQFSQLLRPAGASFTQSADTGYSFGGLASRESDRSVQKADPGYAVEGVVSYDFQTNQWANHSSESFGEYGTSIYGCAEYVPFGPNGLLVFLGGTEAPVDVKSEYLNGVSWTTLRLYDPVTGKWYKQKTTGEPPPRVERACSVGVRGPNNTYEIFIYGGSPVADGSPLSDVYVLSLPGFQFFRSDSRGTPRADHGCAVVGKGKRQMLSYGGVDAGPGLHFQNMTSDPWKQGLGIYDMSEMIWTNSYDVDAADYESPAMVRDWYAQGNMKTMTWDSDELKGLFVNGSSSTYGTMNNSATTEDLPKNSLSSAQKTGVIVGSTVGGVVVLTAIGAAIFIMRRRRRRRQSSRASSTINEYRPEPWPKDSPRLRSTTPGTMTTFVSSQTPVEPVEISGITRGELPAEEVKRTYELPVPTPHATPRLRPELPDRKFSH